tara:strand:+ start:2216 stop:2821 length:606 start_codon:yes stop_codon:yes gene_type:complete
MPRDFSITEAQVDDRFLRFVDLIRLELPDGTIFRFTDCDNDIVSNLIDGSTNETFLAGQGYLGHEPIPLTSQVSAIRTQLNFDSIELDSTGTNIARQLMNKPIAGGTVHIIKRIFTQTSQSFTNTVTTGEYIIFKGIMDNISYKATNDSSRLALFCGGPFSNFDRTAIYGYTNSSSQNKLYPNDTGFAFATYNVRNIKWEE